MNHSFDVDIAVKYGVNAAILLQNIYWWCRKNKANGRNYHDGRYWTYNSRRAFAELFPYLSERQIKTAIDKLIEDGLVVTGCYNKDPRDRSLWYAVTDKGTWILQNVNSDLAEMSDRNVENVRPLPDIKPDIKPDINIIYADDEKEDPYNPFGEGRRPERNTVYAYASNELVSLSQRAMQEIGDYVNDLSEDVVRHAIDNALDQGVRTWAYVKTILNGYVDAEVHSVGDAKRVDEEYSKKRKGGTKQENTDQSTDKKWQDMTPEEQEYALNHGPFGPWVR